MPIPTSCPTCEATFNVADQHAGKRGRCPKCNALVQVPEASSATGEEPDQRRPRRSGASSRRGTSRRPQEPTETGSPLLPILAMGGVAVLGALVWYVIANQIGYEIGWIAWGIGAGIGFAGIALGGRGTPVAAAAAGFALLSILGGKFLATDAAIAAEKKSFRGELLREDYKELLSAGEDWVTREHPMDDVELKGFMAKHDLANGSHASTVRDAELEEFRNGNAPEFLELMGTEPISYKEWSTGVTESAFEDVQTLDILKQNFVPSDLIFGFLGIATAWGLVMKAG